MFDVWQRMEDMMETGRIAIQQTLNDSIQILDHSIFDNDQYYYNYISFWIVSIE
jgi:hypothetical protein